MGHYYTHVMDVAADSSGEAQELIWDWFDDLDADDPLGWFEEGPYLDQLPPHIKFVNKFEAFKCRGYDDSGINQVTGEGFFGVEELKRRF